MSQERQQPKDNRTTWLPPLVSAADVDEANYPRARFDDSIAWTIRETACDRAPTHESIWRHQVGFAGELTAAAYFGANVNWSIYPDYEGDDGYDFTVGTAGVEVKSVTKHDNPVLQVPIDRVDDADYFVLAQCSNPRELVQLIGYISRPALQDFGHRFDGDYRVTAEYLEPFEPLFLPPERIRASQQ